METKQNRTVTLGEYQFSETGHLHTLEGKPLTGVTTVLKVIGKGDALVQWSANMACDYIKEHSNVTESGVYELSSLTIEEARKAWCKNRDKAGSFGSTVHELIENFVMKCHITPVSYDEYTHSEQVITDRLSKEEYEKIAPAFKNFVQWVAENNIEFLECEKHVYSREMWVGGILDLVFKKDGKVYIGDIKTSKGIYPEYFYQMGAYDICLNEMHDTYREVDGYTIINLKKTGQIEVETNYGRQQNKEAFKHCLALYRLLNETKKTI